MVSIEFRGRVGEWLKPADCKSAAPCGLRRFESFPVHQDSARSTKRERQGAAARTATVSDSQDNRRIIANAMFEGGRKRGRKAVENVRAAKRDVFRGKG